jgi:hypothetical protein
MRQYALGHVKCSFTLGGQPITIESSGSTWPIVDATVNLIGRDLAPQTIWSLDERPRIASKAEYETAFRPN